MEDSQPRDLSHSMVGKMNWEDRFIIYMTDKHFVSRSTLVVYGVIGYIAGLLVGILLSR
jgi:H+/Cl- antiporter ClcA